VDGSKVRWRMGERRETTSQPMHGTEAIETYAASSGPCHRWTCGRFAIRARGLVHCAMGPYDELQAGPVV